MPAVNKVIFDGEPLIDLTGDTVTGSVLAEGVTAHAADGTIITGTYPVAKPEEHWSGNVTATSVSISGNMLIISVSEADQMAGNYYTIDADMMMPGAYSDIIITS